MKILWTDGSAEPNPGKGGFAVIEARSKVPATGAESFAEDESQPVVLGSEEESTNIRMKGFAIIAAMKYAGEEGCEIHTDSEFWVNALTKWAPTWKRNGWRKKTGEIKNLEIVKEAYELYTQLPVKLVWVRGHVGTELNEMADVWANKAREGYETCNSSGLVT
ncbi:ribonuclease HI [Candidatus Saccharibacteria bacterium]|nr:ribonuclease HI [Candidatus Saccharibacteria bacterium]